MSIAKFPLSITVFIIIIIIIIIINKEVCICF